jgi:hypothetical protein
MTQAGGPAAINGFLYQILHHLGWLAKASLSEERHHGDPEDMRLILEPMQGGDARAEATGAYLVEQYKTRHDGTWSVSDVIAILGGLYKAVPASRPPHARYRFVTDGRPGRLDALSTFLDAVRSGKSYEDLDNTDKKTFASDKVLTHREFFEHVASALCDQTKTTEDDRTTLFYLLQHFEMSFDSNGDSQAGEVERLLRRYAPDLGDERGIRERLVGVLVERLSKGETDFGRKEIDQLFSDVGLNIERLGRLAQLAETVSARTQSRMSRLRYQPTRDVRAAPSWPAGKAVMLIAGGSGAGKTWQLGGLMEDLTKLREIATFVPVATSLDQVLADAARDIWQTGLGETRKHTLPAIARFLRELVAEPASRQITIAADDIQNVDLARALVRQDWGEWNMRIVMTVPHAISRSLMISDPDIVGLHMVEDFSVDELDRLMHQSDRLWSDLPSDLMQILRKPILAGLFLSLPYQSAKRAPRSEYEIFDAFWGRIAAKARPGDEGILLALAAHVIDGGSYPMLRKRWRDIGLSDESFARLNAAGWMQADESGSVSFAHDRLLNWAVAKELVRRYRAGEITPQVVADAIIGARRQSR